MVDKGEILIAIYGANSGDIAISKMSGAINQAILSYDTKANKQFFKNLWQRNVGVILETYLQGGQGNLSAEIIKNLKFYFPNIDEQNKIASSFELIELRINTQKKTIETIKSLKISMSKKILSQGIRLKNIDGNHFSDWDYVKLGDLLDYEQPTNYLVSSTEYDNSYQTPVLTAGKTFILGYTNEKHGIFDEKKLPVIIFDDFTTASQYVTFPFKAKSSAMKILAAKNGHNIKYIFEAMQQINYEIGGHGRHWISVFSDIEIPIPSIQEQSKIANFLNAFDKKIQLEAEILSKLEEQKRYFLQNLFV